MAGYPPKKNAIFIFYASVVATGSRPDFKSSATIAAGDFKVSTDGGALANLGTIPVVTPGSSVMIKFTLSASEMNGDNITVVCIDAAGAEWDDLLINIQTSVAVIDDIADKVWDEPKSGHATPATFGYYYQHSVDGVAESGTLTTTVMTTDLGEATADHYIGRIIVFITGNLAGQATDIVDYVGSAGTVTMSALTEAPANGDKFIIF